MAQIDEGSVANVQLKPWMLGIVGAIVLGIGLFLGFKSSTVDSTDCGSVFVSNEDSVELQDGLHQLGNLYDGGLPRSGQAQECADLLAVKRTPTWVSVVIGGLLLLLAYLPGAYARESNHRRKTERK